MWNMPRNYYEMWPVWGRTLKTLHYKIRHRWWWNNHQCITMHRDLGALMHRLFYFGTFSQVWCVTKLLFLTHKYKSLITSHRMLFAVTVNRNNQSWKKLNLARTLADKLETFTWLSEIRQNYIMESSISRLWIKCTLVHFTFHLKSDTLNESTAQQVHRHFTQLDSHFLRVSALPPQKFTYPPCLWGSM